MFTSFDAIVRCQATDEAIICCQADLEWITYPVLPTLDASSPRCSAPGRIRAWLWTGVVSKQKMVLDGVKALETEQTKQEMYGGEWRHEERQCA
ncbi:unnamed protein product [Boreogadus saida]